MDLGGSAALKHKEIRIVKEAEIFKEVKITKDLKRSDGS